jgi:hypothetical protein
VDRLEIHFVSIFLLFLFRLPALGWDGTGGGERESGVGEGGEGGGGRASARHAFQKFIN